jgi:hypothetical protein
MKKTQEKMGIKTIKNFWKKVLKKVDISTKQMTLDLIFKRLRNHEIDPNLERRVDFMNRKFNFKKQCSRF